MDERSQSMPMLRHRRLQLQARLPRLHLLRLDKPLNPARRCSNLASPKRDFNSCLRFMNVARSLLPILHRDKGGSQMDQLALTQTTPNSAIGVDWPV